MSASNRSTKQTVTDAAKRQSLAEWEQLLRRYPVASRAGLAFQIGSTLASNGLVVWLITTGRMTPFELVLLVAIETVLLISIAWGQSRTVPPEAREPNAMPLVDRLRTLAFMLVWLGAVYSVVLFVMVPSAAEIQSALRDPLGFLSRSTLKWPLLITLATAAVDALQDAAHFRRHAGRFLSTPGFQGGARLLTLILGGIPFVVPFFGIVIGIKLAGERIAAAVQRRFGKPSERVLIVMLLMIPLAGWLALHGVAWVVTRIDNALDSGVAWWALCYGAAKFVAELFIVCLPLIASKAHAEEADALANPTKARAKRKSRLP